MLLDIILADRGVTAKISDRRNGARLTVEGPNSAEVAPIFYRALTALLSPGAEMMSAPIPVELRISFGPHPNGKIRLAVDYPVNYERCPDEPWPPWQLHVLEAVRELIAVAPDSPPSRRGRPKETEL